MKEKAPNAKGTYCMIHRYASASKTLPVPLQDVLSSVIKIVNFVKGSALQTHLFKQLCKEMGPEHDSLLFYTQVRWLSKGISLRVWLLFIRLELKTSQKGNIKMLKCIFLGLHYCLSSAFQYVWYCDSVQYKWECVWNRNSLAFWAAERTNVILIGGSTNVICINVTRMKV